MSLKRLPMAPPPAPIHPIFPSFLQDAPLVESPAASHNATDFFHDLEAFSSSDATSGAGAGDSFFAAFENVPLDHDAPDLFDFACDQEGSVVVNGAGEEIDAVLSAAVRSTAPLREKSDYATPTPQLHNASTSSSSTVQSHSPQITTPAPQHTWHTTFTDPERQHADILRVLWKPSKQPITPQFTKKVYATLKYTLHVELLTNSPLESCCLTQIQIIHAHDDSKDFSEHITAESVLLARAARVTKEYKSQYKYAYKGTLKVALQGPKLSSYITKRQYRFRIVGTCEEQDAPVLQCTSNVFKVYSRKEDKSKIAKRKRKREASEEEASQSEESASTASPPPKRRCITTKETSPNINLFSAKLEEIFAIMSKNLPSKAHQERAWQRLFESQVALL